MVSHINKLEIRQHPEKLGADARHSRAAMARNAAVRESIIFDFSGVIGPKFKSLESGQRIEKRILNLVWGELNPSKEMLHEKIHELKRKHRTEALHATIKKELDERGSRLDFDSILKTFYNAERHFIKHDFSA